ncbi:MAG: disulfide bond formation protein DsbA [Actinobacteria bacterium]|nr:disulfide bond formation protein DsbA [Actinomycetota bacterium]MDA2984503.1 disulfide bond formation protein DsbA [Actinomycetota bacterium]
MTSRWILEVEKVRDIDVTFNIFSLAHLNRENEQYRDNFPKSWRTTRVIMAAKTKHGQEYVLPLYTAIGLRIHLKKMEIGSELLREALVEVGLPVELADEMDNESWNQSIIESHERGITLVGNDVGTPLIKVGDFAFFGPVISPAPKGEEAGKLWDGVVGVAAFPGFFEIKRSRTVRPIFD